MLVAAASESGVCHAKKGSVNKPATLYHERTCARVDAVAVHTRLRIGHHGWMCGVVAQKKRSSGARIGRVVNHERFPHVTMSVRCAFCLYL